MSSADPETALREALTDEVMLDIASAMPWYDEANPDYTEGREAIIRAALATPEPRPLDVSVLRRALMDRELVVLDTRDHGGMRMSDTAAAEAISAAYQAAKESSDAR